jgi:predicted acetyltransferase
MKLQAVTATAPPGALELLTALGDGENGFGGTPVGSDPAQLDDWLDYCRHIAEAPPLSDDFVPQINYWITDAAGLAVGLLRMRPDINAELLNKGGHVGYYVAPAHRNLGYAKGALKLALDKLRVKGVSRALITVESHNTVSSRLVTALGGILEDERIDGETGQPYLRFWLETDHRTKTKRQVR